MTMRYSVSNLREPLKHLTSSKARLTVDTCEYRLLPRRNIEIASWASISVCLGWGFEIELELGPGRREGTSWTPRLNPDFGLLLLNSEGCFVNTFKLSVGANWASLAGVTECFVCVRFFFSYFYCASYILNVKKWGNHLTILLELPYEV